MSLIYLAKGVSESRYKDSMERNLGLNARAKAFLFLLTLGIGTYSNTM